MVGMCSQIMRERGAGVETSSSKLLMATTPRLYGLGGSKTQYIYFSVGFVLGRRGRGGTGGNKSLKIPIFSEVRDARFHKRSSSLVHLKYPLEFVFACTIFFSVNIKPHLDSKVCS